MRKIAIIDSGVDSENLPDKVHLAASYKFITKKTEKHICVYFEESNFFDDYHGTSVLYSIKKYCKNVEIECYSYNVYDKQLASSYSVLEALKECLKIEKLDIVVMSISFEESLKTQIDALLEELAGKNIKIFCAVKNEHTESYPANSEYVIGVKAGDIINNGKYIYNPENRIQVITNSEYEFFETHSGRILCFRGNSKANGVVAGIALNELEKGADRILYSNVDNDDFLEYKEKKLCREEELLYLLNEFQKKGFDIKISQIDEKWYIDEMFVKELRAFIEQYSGKTEYSELNYYDVSNFRRLATYVNKRRKKVL